MTIDEFTEGEATQERPTRKTRGPNKPKAAIVKAAAPQGVQVTIQSRTVSEADSHLPLEAIISNVPGGPYQAFGETEAIALFNAAKRWIIMTDQQKAA